MIDRQWMLQWQEAREKSDRDFRERVAGANRHYRIVELILVAATMLVIIIAAFAVLTSPFLGIK